MKSEQQVNSRGQTYTFDKMWIIDRRLLALGKYGWNILWALPLLKSRCSGESEPSVRHKMSQYSGLLQARNPRNCKKHLQSAFHESTRMRAKKFTNHAFIEMLDMKCYRKTTLLMCMIQELSLKRIIFLF